MNKRHLHHIWTKLRLVRPWYLLVVTLVSGTVCVFALRANNQHMLNLRDAVYAADRDDGDVQSALNRLQAYVTSHMNTNLSTGSSVYPPIQLKYTYQRLVQAEQDAAADSNNQTQLYTDAQAYCQALNPVDFSGHNRVPCIEQFVQTHGNVTSPTVAPIPDALYKFSFVSPSWSPDLAGWSLVATVVSGLLCIILLLVQRWFRRNVA